MFCRAGGGGPAELCDPGMERLKAAAGMSIMYSSIIWTEIEGIVLFHEIPNAWAIAGIVIVVCSTLYTSLKQAMVHGAPVLAPPSSQLLQAELPTQGIPGAGSLQA